MERKIQKKYIDHSLGFPVILKNAPLIRARGEWALNVNYNDYQRTILQLLAHKPTRLTGNEVAFVRKYFEHTAREFASRFSVKHPAVLKWERKNNASTQMGWSTEKDIRLFILDELKEKASEVHALYRSLKDAADGSTKPIVVNGDEIAA
ncbi:MAG: hypothetical protein AB7T49_17825 [Oligoflexales bacterium]